MSDVGDADLKALIEVMGKALDLPIRDDNASVVEAHLRIAFAMAKLVEEFPLPDEAEPAPVFSA